LHLWKPLTPPIEAHGCPPKKGNGENNNNNNKILKIKRPPT
jgi:hypothetical protein